MADIRKELIQHADNALRAYKTLGGDAEQNATYLVDICLSTIYSSLEKLVEDYAIVSTDHLGEHEIEGVDQHITLDKLREVFKPSNKRSKK